MSWQKILTQDNMETAPQAAGILTSKVSDNNGGWNDALLSALSAYPSTGGEKVALGIVHDGSQIKWDLIDDFGDSATAGTLTDTLSGLGAMFVDDGQGAITFDPTAGGTITTASLSGATDVSNALDLLDAAIGNAGGGTYTAPSGQWGDNDILVAGADDSFQTVVSQNTFLAGKQDADDSLSQIVNVLGETDNNQASKNVVMLWDVEADGTIGVGDSSVAWKNTEEWDTAYTHSQANHAPAGATVGADWSTNLANIPTTIVHDTDFSAGIMKSDGSGNYSAVTDNSADWNAAHGWGRHDNTANDGTGTARYDAFGTAAALANTTSNSFTLNNGAAVSAEDKAMLVSSNKKLKIKTAADDDVTLEVENVNITGSMPIQFEGDATVGGEFVAVNSDFDWSDAEAGNGGYADLIAAGGQGLKINRDPNGDSALIKDSSKLQWIEQNATGNGKHGRWHADIIYSDGSAGAQEHLYSAPLVTVLDGLNWSVGTADADNPNLLDDTNDNGGMDPQQVLLRNSSDIGSFFIGADSSVWIKTSADS